MRILQINNYGYVRGGSDRYFVDIGALLSRAGHDVNYFVPKSSKNVVDNELAVEGFNIESPSISDLPRYFYSFSMRDAAQKVMRSFRPDIVHLHIFYGQITPSVLDVFGEDVPIVQTVHEYKLICPVASATRDGRPCEDCGAGAYWRAAWHRCNRHSLARSVVSAGEAYLERALRVRKKIDHFIAVSDFVAKRLESNGFQRADVSVLHNFVREEAFGEPDRSRGYFLYSGRLEEIKGVSTLLQAVSRVPSAQLIIAGDGGGRGAFEELVKQLGISDRVRFVGFQPQENLRELIRGSLCCVVPSEWNEPFGLVIIESFALGKPVIASRIGGMTEIVEDGEDGLLFTAGDASELAARIEWVMSNPDLVAEMGCAGQRKARTNFSAERHLAGLMNIYHKVGAL